jgi:hypothetical protein
MKHLDLFSGIGGFAIAARGYWRPCTMTEKTDPLAPATLRELAGMGIAVTGKYLREVADHIEQQGSKLDGIKTTLQDVLVRNQGDQITDGDAMSEIHEMFYQWFQAPPK